MHQKRLTQRLLLPLLLTSILFLLGCPSSPIENIARDGIATASGFIAHEVNANQDVCRTTPTTAKCSAIKKSSQGLAVVINSLEEWCSGPEFEKGTGACQPPTDKTQKNQLANKLTAALKDLDRDIADIKALGGAQ